MFLFSCENDIEQVKELTARQDSAIISAQQVKIVYTTNGKKNVVMDAPELDRYQDGKENSIIEFPKGLKMYFYDETGKETSSLRANYSIYYEKEGKWIAKYDVEAVNEDGVKLNTEYLVWLQNEALIKTDHFVKVTTNEGIIYGDDGFVSDQTFSEWEVINGRGVLNVNGNE